MLIGAVDVDDVVLLWIVASADECDLRAVGRPGRPEVVGRIGGDRVRIRSVGVHDHDVAACGIRDQRAVGAPVGQLILRRPVRGERSGARPVGVHDPDLARSGPIAHPCDVLAVGRPGHVGIASRSRGQLGEPGPVDVHRPHVAFLVWRVGGRGTRERDHGAVGRDLREEHPSTRLGDLSLVRPVAVHHPDLERPGTITAEDDRRAVGRERRAEIAVRIRRELHLIGAVGGGDEDLRIVADPHRVGEPAGRFVRGGRCVGRPEAADCGPDRQGGAGDQARCMKGESLGCHGVHGHGRLLRTGCTRRDRPATAVQPACNTRRV